MSLDFRQVLQELVTEGSGEVLTCLASKLRGEQVEEVRHLVGEEGEEYRLEPTGMLVIPKLKHSESAPNILFHQEARHHLRRGRVGRWSSRATNCCRCRCGCCPNFEVAAA